ncbi:CRISPR-associated helicase Cas3, partial [mine drainage metagenome]
QSTLTRIGFAERFGFANPHPLQTAVDALDPLEESTRLVIAEAETGSGKTEAALAWFFNLFAEGRVDGLYFALPTRVAARQLYERVCKYINRVFPDPQCRPVTVLAVPGYPLLDGLPPERALPTQEAGNRWQDDETLRRRERQWSAERPKRFLAATVAVGTVDQALLSVVQTAHAHLRSVCLDRSLLVVDEVHASDVYMSRLLEVLLGHHLGVGGHAMLLSATLGSRARGRYVAVAGGECPLPSAVAATQVPYPALTFADG